MFGRHLVAVIWMPAALYMWCRHLICRHLICRHIWRSGVATSDMATAVWPTYGCRHLAVWGADIWLLRPGSGRLGPRRLGGQIWESGSAGGLDPCDRGAGPASLGSGRRALGSRHLGMSTCWMPRSDRMAYVRATSGCRHLDAGSRIYVVSAFDMPTSNMPTHMESWGWRHLI